MKLSLALILGLYIGTMLWPNKVGYNYGKAFAEFSAGFSRAVKENAALRERDPA